MLDLVFSKHLGKRWLVRGFGKNILNPDFKQVYTNPGNNGKYHGTAYVYRQYKKRLRSIAGHYLQIILIHMHIQTINRKIAAVLLLALVSMSACLKEKKDNLIEPLDVLQKSNSSIRMFNLTGAAVDVMISNIPLAYFQQHRRRPPAGVEHFPRRQMELARQRQPIHHPERPAG